MPERITGSPLLWMTSQSGHSGGAVAVAERLRGANRPALFLETTNDETSPLADASDIVLALHSGDEAPVSTESDLNTLASHAVDVELRLAESGDEAGAIGSALCVRRA